MNSLVIAKYIRLSMDEAVTDSLSIPNQRRILDAHIDDLDLPTTEILEFVDNDYSGVDMERPAVQELIELVRLGKIHAICVKDFSRFSRNALESGYYIEQVFPLYNVRFISVSDRFDSKDYKNDTGGIDIAFKFLMHEYYSIDLSKKVKSAYRIKMNRGENIVAKAIYGYHKAHTGKWEPEEFSSDVVRLIFKMALDGMPTAVIRDKLFELKFPTPQEHLDRIFSKKDEVRNREPKCRWSAKMVLHMLQNEQYTGTYVSGKQESKAIGSNSKIYTDKSEWIIIPNSHTPIVSKEVFDEVQLILNNRKTSTTQKPTIGAWRDNVTCAKRKSLLKGEMKLPNPPYGYRADAEKEYEIDPIAADIVREIFARLLDGQKAADIAQLFCESNLPIPREYWQIKRGQSIKPACQWTANRIREIAKNEKYTGTYIAGKIVKDHETGKKYRPHKSEWVVIPNRHPAIVSQETFDEVQGILAESKRAGYKTRTKSKSKDNLLYGGIAKCGCCGYALVYDKRNGGNDVYYCYHTLADQSAACCKMKVKAKEVHSAVLTTIKKQAELLLDASRLSDLQKVNISTSQLLEYETQHRELNRQRQWNYERFVEGEIEKAEYIGLKAELAEQLEKLNQQIALYRQSEQARNLAKKTVATAKDVLGGKLSEREIVELLVDKVMIFPGEHMEIRWKIEDFAVEG